jgi:hypothetical protein
MQHPAPVSRFPYVYAPTRRRSCDFTELLFTAKDADDDEEPHDEPPVSKAVKAKKGRGAAKAPGGSRKRGKGKKSAEKGSGDDAPAGVSSSLVYSNAIVTHNDILLGFHECCTCSFQPKHHHVYHHP